MALTASVFLGQFVSPLVSNPVLSQSGYEGLFRGAALLFGTMALGSGMAFIGRHIRSVPIRS